MKLFTKKKVVDWTPVDFLYKSGGGCLDLGSHALPHHGSFATDTINKTMTDRGVPLSRQDKNLVYELCQIDGLSIKAPTLIIDPTRINRRRFSVERGYDVPEKPWSVIGGKFLLVATVCVYGITTPHETLGVSDVGFYYCPNTFNGTVHYLNLTDSNGRRISNTGHTNIGTVRQTYHLKLEEFQRTDILDLTSNLLEAYLTNTARNLPETIHAIASIG